MIVARVAERQTSPARNVGSTWAKRPFIVRNWGDYD
jgi:hypothetical protein